jgi:hypothetical protein
MHTVQWPHCAAQNENEQHDNGCHVVTQKLLHYSSPKKEKGVEMSKNLELKVRGGVAELEQGRRMGQ